MEIHRCELYDALRPINQHRSGILIWDQQFDQHFFKFDSIAIENLGTCVLPYSRENLTVIANKYQQPVDEDGQARNAGQSRCCVVTAEEMVIHSRNSQKEVLNQLIDMALKEKFIPGLENTSINVDACINSLVICQPSDSYVKIQSRKTKFGTFGTMLIQLPVDPENSVSANIKVLHDGEEQSLEYEQKLPFYLTFVAGYNNSIKSTKLAVQCTGSNPVVFLLYDLVWLDSYRLVRDLNPHVLLDFMERMNCANQALFGWKDVSFDQLENLPSKDGLKRLLSMYSSLAPQETALLCIPTIHSYHSYEFHLESLKTDDVLMVNLLKTLHYIDVSIVILTFEQKDKGPVTEEAPYRGMRSWRLSPGKGGHPKPFFSWRKEAVDTKETTVSVKRWIQGDWTFPTLHEKFSSIPFDHCKVADVESVLRDALSSNQLDSEEPSRKKARLQADSSSSSTCHPTIVIRPRQAAIFDCWKHCPIRTLECLTQRVKSGLGCNYSHDGLERSILIQEVDLILDLLTKDKDKLSDCQRTAILHQLLYLCTRLQIRLKGLEIMALIIESQCKCRKAHTDGFEGFFGEESLSIEQVVVEWVSLVGWETCGSLVREMYSRREAEDYTPLSKLSCALKDLGCIDGAITFANGCLMLLVTHEECFNQTEEFEEDYINFYLDLSVSQATSNIHRERQETYTLLGKLALREPENLHFMILYYFKHLDVGEENLSDLKLTIAGLIVEIDRYHEGCSIHSVICFAYRTRNAELAEHVWSKILNDKQDEVDKKEKGQFEMLLSSEQFWQDFDQFEDIYKAIALSPLATERFYKFIEDQKPVRNSLKRCFFHFTMAQSEPSLVDQQKMRSYLLRFKEMDVDTLTNAAHAIVSHEEQDDRRISQTLVSALIAALPTDDMEKLISQETDDFCNIMYCYLKLASEHEQHVLFDILNETFLDGWGFGFGESTLLIAFFESLEAKFDDKTANRSVVAYHVLSFSRVFFIFSTVTCHSKLKRIISPNFLVV